MGGSNYSEQDKQMDEQMIKGLAEVAKQATTFRVNSAIKHAEGDVPCLSAHHPDHGYGNYEICFCHGAYDAWLSGNLHKTGLSAQEASIIVALDYCSMKAKAVAVRRKMEAGGDMMDIYKRAFNEVCEHHGLAGMRH